MTIEFFKGKQSKHLKIFRLGVCILSQRAATLEFLIVFHWRHWKSSQWIQKFKFHNFKIFFFKLLQTFVKEKIGLFKKRLFFGFLYFLLSFSQVFLGFLTQATFLLFCFTKKSNTALLPYLKNRSLVKEMASSLFFFFTYLGLRRTCTLMTSNAFTYPSLIKISE